MHWQRLYEQLSAIETIGVGRQGPGLNHRGERLLRYLRTRWRRRFASPLS